MKKYLILILLIVAFFSNCNQTKKEKENNIDTEKSLEDQVLEAVIFLPEYKEADQIVRAMTSNKQQLTCIINEPEGKDNRYHIEAGYNKETWFEPYYHFYVDTKTLKVSILDKEEGDIVPIEVWREREDKR